MPISELQDSPTIDERAIDDLEQRLGVSLPPDYRDFLLRTNGGRPYPEDAFGDDDHGSIISIFYSVEHERKTFTIEQARFAFSGRIPEDLLPIAVDLGGNRVCIGIGKKNYGRVYFWSMDDEVKQKRKPDYSNVELITDSFGDFLASFYDADA